MKMFAATKVFCRTCEDSKETSLSDLEQKSMKFPTFNYLVLLKLVTNLEIDTNSSLPTYICNDCIDKLENAYAFIQQAVKSDQLWRNYDMKRKDYTSNSSLTGECLDELPIDIPMTDLFSHCLLEKNMNDYSLSKHNESLENITYDRYSNNDKCDVTSSMVAHQNEPVNLNDPITMEESKIFEFNDVSCKEDISLNEKSSETTYKECDYIDYLQASQLHHDLQTTSQETNSLEKPKLEILSSEVVEKDPPKKKRGRPRLKRKQTVDHGEFECLECKEIFQTHTKLKSHKEENHLRKNKGFSCSFCSKKFSKKCTLNYHQLEHQHGAEWFFGDCLYSEKPLALRKCCLCNSFFMKKRLLRNHLMEHGINKNLEAVNSSFLFKEFNPNSLNSPLEILESIYRRLNDKDFQQFVVVRNHFGYEMSLSDTDVNDSDSEISEKIEYFCLVCQEKCETKCRMFKHMRDKHKNDTNVPFKCDHCSLSFCSEQMFRQHVRTQCGNESKIHKCSECPGRFKWKDSLLGHECPNRKKRRSAALKQVRQNQINEKSCKDLIKEENHNKKMLIKCCLCTEEFANIVGLKQHLVIHADGQTKCDPSKGAFYRLFHPDATSEQLKLITRQIVEDFQQLNFLKYYIVSDEEGFEYDLNEIDNDYNEHKCGICSLEFPNLKAITEHQNGSHDFLTDTWPYSCPKCNQKLLSAYLYERHKRRECHELLLQKYQCEFCHQAFIWLENLEKHLFNKHQSTSNQYKYNVNLYPSDTQAAFKKETRSTKLIKYNAVDEKLCKPHGCKQIKCMICLSKHTKISDLKSHLLGHQFSLPWSIDQTPVIDVQQLINQFYLNNGKDIKTLDDLINRVKFDIKNQNMEAFHSITNEVGYELHLSSSETESDSDSDSESASDGCNENQTNLARKHVYICEICDERFSRKYLIYKHHKETHDYLEAKHVCNHCQGRFLCKELLQHHEVTQCLSQLKRFHCRKCPRRFMWEDNFRLHNQYHIELENKQRAVIPNENSYKCNECNRSFVMLKDLTRHMVMHNSDFYTIKCYWCPRKFYRKKNLIMHAQRHEISADQFDYAISLMKFHYNAHGRKEIYCKICKVKFNKISTLRKHLLYESALAMKTHYNYNSMLNYSITNEMGFELDINDSETDNDTHTNTDSDVNCKLYKCEICNLVFNRKYRLSLHQQSVHKYEKLPLKCDKCLFKTVSTDILKYHKEMHCYNKEKLHECVKCSYRFMWPENLNVHNNLLHQMEDSTVVVEAIKADNTSQKHVFQCDICHCKYNRKDRLTAHIKKIHSLNKIIQKQDFEINTVAKTNSNETVIPSSNKKVSQAEKKSNQRYLCAFCGKAVTSSSNLIIHMRRHTGEKPFKCDFCDMAFPRSSDLQCHRRTHTGEKPHQCTICEKSFARSYKLHQHMRIHSGERPYKCTYCEKSFTQSNDLTLHVRRHTGERPYLCGVCGERFIQGTALKNHRLMRGHFEEIQSPQTQSLSNHF